ncbi:MAG TPA: response regulator transcription factor [Bryobacteraceae bacterium]|jgi:two-component system invasion response regulator UvrY|nr:response regulator transcription factor [Bryobacteraceae bacterium]
MTRILVADDHPLLRSGLKQLLSQEPDLEVVGEAEDSEQVLRQAADSKCDVVILDLAMPGRGGLDALRELRRQHPHLPVLILSMHSEDQFAVRAIRAGASGYVSKETAGSEVVKAVRKVLTGKKYVSPGLAEMLANALDQDLDRPPHEALSDREFQILSKIASGMTVSEIAEEISLSVKTVSTYRSRVLEKMSMHTNAELTRYALQNGLVS